MSAKASVVPLGSLQSMQAPESAVYFAASMSIHMQRMSGLQILRNLGEASCNVHLNLVDGTAQMLLFRYACIRATRCVGCLWSASLYHSGCGHKQPHVPHGLGTKHTKT